MNTDRKTKSKDEWIQARNQAKKGFRPIGHRSVESGWAFVFNKSEIRGVGEGIADIAVIADIARDRKSRAYH